MNYGQYVEFGTRRRSMAMTPKEIERLVRILRGEGAGAGTKAEDVQILRKLEARERSSVVTHPEGISDGLSLPCHFCGRVPVVDYHVDDAFWREHVPDEARLGVVCIECLVERAPEAAWHVEEVQVATPFATTVFAAVETRRWTHKRGPVK
jgi:hypothetical protein